MTRRRFLVLGCGEGWHAEQLRAAAVGRDCDLAFATYESLSATIGSPVGGEEPGSAAPGGRRQDAPSPAAGPPPMLHCEAGPLDSFDGLLTRTMPGGSLEQITFRLAVLHDYLHAGCVMVNPPRALEIAIDKFATLAEVARLGYEVPATVVVQSRGEAMEAFGQLGEDCVVKPIFGGEGRGVMRIRESELAWTTFSTLQQLGSVYYVQQFVPPGGCDTRVLVIGDRLLGVRRTNGDGFRTNVGGGGRSQAIEPSAMQTAAARRITRHLGLKFAAVDFLAADDGIDRVVEVNAVPGWKAAQGSLSANIAELVIDGLLHESNALPGSCQHAGT